LSIEFEKYRRAQHRAILHRTWSSFCTVLYNI
jgi:hypothetical protein